MVAGDASDFDEAAYKESLAAMLDDVEASDIELTISAGSIRVSVPNNNGAQSQTSATFAQSMAGKLLQRVLARNALAAGLPSGQQHDEQSEGARKLKQLQSVLARNALAAGSPSGQQHDEQPDGARKLKQG